MSNKVVLPVLPCLLAEFFDICFDIHEIEVDLQYFANRYDSLSVLEKNCNKEVEDLEQKYCKANGVKSTKELEKYKLEQFKSDKYDIESKIVREKNSIIKSCGFNYAFGFSQCEGYYKRRLELGIPRELISRKELITTSTARDYIEKSCSYIEELNNNSMIVKRAYDKVVSVYENNRTILNYDIPDLDTTCSIISDIFTVSNGDRFKKWCNGVNKSMKDETAFALTVYLIYLFFITGKNNKLSKQYIRCLDYLGVSKNRISISSKADSADNYDLFVLATLILFGQTGKTGNEIVFEYFNQMVTKASEGAREEIITALRSAEHKLFKEAEWFEPRGVDRNEKRKISDIYVLPEFDNGVKPISLIDEADSAERLVIVGKSGLGKSMYVNAIILSELYEAFVNDEVSFERYRAIADSIGAKPNKKLVIYVNANMYSNAWSPDRDIDLVELFFSNYWSENDHFEYSDAFREVVKSYAKQGRMLFLFDAFDELSSNRMTSSFARSLRKCVDEYCYLDNNTDEKIVGAHIIVTTRKRLNQTMAYLDAVMRIDEESHVVIRTFNSKQQEELIGKWRKVLAFDEEMLMNKITFNKYYKELASTPAFLGLLCNTYGRELKSIIGTYIDTLISKTLNLNHDDEDVRDMLDGMYIDIKEVLETLAFNSLLKGESNISKEDIFDSIKETVLEYFLENLTGDQEEIKGKLLPVLTTEIGLLISSEDIEDSYEFINEIIRYYLSVEYINKTGGVELLNDMNTEELCNVAVPLICSYNTSSDFSKIEYILKELLMKRAIVDKNKVSETVNDLYYGSYGPSLLTAAHVGRNIEERNKALKNLLKEVGLLY